MDGHVRTSERPTSPPPSPRPHPSPRRRSGAGAPATLDAILSIPVTVQVVLGDTTMPVASLMKLGRGAVISLDQKVGDPVNVLVNGRTSRAAKSWWSTRKPRATACR